MRWFSFKLVSITLVIFIALGVSLYFGSHNKAPEVLPVEPVQTSEEVGPKYKVLGFSVEGRKIESYTYGTGEKHVVFVGGIHGGYEWNTVLLAEQVIDYLDENVGVIPKNLTVTIIPSANPDGIYKVTQKEGAFVVTDVSTDKQVLASGRFNAHNVDLNRNFDCKWKPESTWQSKVVSAGSAPFSEPESLVLKNFVLENNPDAVIFWHSQANAVYASKCQGEILSGTIDIMNAYAKASGYSAVKTFDSYETTGDSEGWLASIGVPSITVELKTHEVVEFQKNISGVKAIFEYYSQEKIDKMQ